MTPSDEMLKSRALMMEKHHARALLEEVKKNDYCGINADILSRDRKEFWIAIYYPNEMNYIVKSVGCNHCYGMFVSDGDDKMIDIRYMDKSFSFYPKTKDQLIIICKYMLKFYNELF